MAHRTDKYRMHYKGGDACWLPMRTCYSIQTERLNYPDTMKKDFEASYVAQDGPEGLCGYRSHMIEQNLVIASHRHGWAYALLPKMVSCWKFFQREGGHS